MSYADYIPKVAWSTLIDNVVFISTGTFTVKVTPLDLSDPGAFPLVHGNYLMDNRGLRYLITSTASYPTITVSDVFGAGFAPFQGKIGYVYQSSGNGFSESLPANMFEKLDEKAFDYGYRLDMNIIWLSKEDLLNKQNSLTVDGSGIKYPTVDATNAGLALKVDKNTAIAGATKTKITYDAKGLVTVGEDATTADIADSLNKRYVSDAERTAITHSNRSALDLVSGTNTGDQTSDTVIARRLGTSTYSTVQHIQDLFHSSGWTSGGVITNAGGGLITVSAGTGLIRATDSDVATIFFTDFPASSPANVVLVDGSQNYIYVEYNAGVPRIIATTTQRADYNTNFLIGAVYRIGTTIHINSTVKTAVSDHAHKMILFNKEVMPYARANGSMISATGVRGFAITAGTFWNGLIRFTTNAFSTATNSFFYFYRNGVGGWTRVGTQTQINNTQFDNGTGTLGTLSNNKYGVHWIFIDVDGDTYVVYGQGDYTLIEAQEAMVPASLPVEVTSHGFVVGKVIIEKSVATFAQIESAFAMGFSTATASEHNSLSGLNTGDLLHLTEAQKTIATQEATNLLAGYVGIGAQTFGGIKTFTLSPIVPTPTTNTQASNKSYVDEKVADTITDGVTTIAPSQNAVFDALALKEPNITKNTAFNKNYSTVATDIKMNGVQALGSLDTIPRADHIHPTDTSREPANANIQDHIGTAHADMFLANSQTVSGLKTFLSGMFGLRNVANTFTSFFTNVNTAIRTYTLPDKSGTVAMTSDIIAQLNGTINYLVKFGTATTGVNSSVREVGTQLLINNSEGFPNSSYDVALGFNSNKTIAIEDSDNTIEGKDLSIKAGRAINFTKSNSFISSVKNGTRYMHIDKSNGDIYYVSGNFINKIIFDNDTFTTSVNSNIVSPQSISVNYTTKDVWVIALYPAGNPPRISKQTAGSGLFVEQVVSGISNYVSSGGNVASCSIFVNPVNSDIFVGMPGTGGGFYKQTGGVGAFSKITGAPDTLQPTRIMCNPLNNDVFICHLVGSTGYLLKQTGGAGVFTQILTLEGGPGSVSSLFSFDIEYSTGTIYTISGGHLSGFDIIYKQTNGSGSFIIQTTTNSPITYNFQFPPSILINHLGNVLYFSDKMYIQTNYAIGTANLKGGALKLKAGTGKGTGQSRIEFITGAKLGSGTDMQIETVRGTIDEDGTLSWVGNITAASISGTIGAAGIVDGSITNAKLANMATKTYKGRTSALTGVPEDVAVATLKTDLLLVKADVGLGNVDNTSDVNKPVSIAQQAALALKEPNITKNTAFNKNYSTVATDIKVNGIQGLGILDTLPRADHIHPTDASRAAALSGTINEIAYFNSATTIASLPVATYPSLTELSYVKGVTSSIQTQINSKEIKTIDASNISNVIFTLGNGNSIIESFGHHHEEYVLNTEVVFRVGNISVGTSIIWEEPLATYNSLFFDYSATNGTSARTGTVMVTVLGTLVEYTEISTNDIGVNTDAIIMSVDLNTGNIRLKAAVTSGTWIVKTIMRKL